MAPKVPRNPVQIGTICTDHREPDIRFARNPVQTERLWGSALTCHEQQLKSSFIAQND